MNAIYWETICIYYIQTWPL